MTTTNEFNFTFSGNHKAELIAYVERIIETTKAQVQAKREHVKQYIAMQENPTEEDIAQINRMFNENYSDTLANRQLRMQIVEDLTECYRGAAGDWPDGLVLERLTNAILHEELTDPNPHKISQEEYPFLSEVQAERRQFGQRGSQSSNIQGEKVTDLSGMKDEDSSGKHHNSPADHLDCDGRSRRKPIRRTRGTHESLEIEKRTKSKNRERRRKYQEFTKVQPVKRWNLYTGEVYE